MHNAENAATRNSLKAVADKTLETWGLDYPVVAGMPDNVRECLTEFEAGLFQSRTVLSARRRLIVWISAAAVLGRFSRISWLVSAADASGLTHAEISEILLQCGLYAGFAATEQAFAAAGIPMPAQPDTDTQPEFGLMAEDMLVQLHGPRRKTGYADPSRPYLGDFYKLVASYSYGVIWARPGLALSDRLICAVGAMACIATGKASLQKFVQSARNHGLAKVEIAEIVLQTAPYAGFPATFTAMRNVVEILDPPADD